MNIIPTDELGERNQAKEMDNYSELIEDPNQLLDKRLNFMVIIDFA